MNRWMNAIPKFFNSFIQTSGHRVPRYCYVNSAKKTVANSVATDVYRNHFVSLHKDFLKTFEGLL